MSRMISCAAALLAASAPASTLPDLQQRFVDMRFGMFIHFNIPTFMDQDWADPDAPASLFDPDALDCRQWARAAKSAHMTFGVLTTKHHSGFCIWDTKTTDYNVMNSPLRRDVVREYVDAFRGEGLRPMLYFSILDTHHRLRPGRITKEHIEMVKAQLTELLTHYGPIDAVILDGWDAPWSRISYEDIPFEEIYRLIKSLQPDCLVMDLNSAKYPAEALLYTDIKSYEQNAGQHISKEANRLPSLSCLPINSSWFWKTSFPTDPVKNPDELVRRNLVPMNEAWCSFILNVAPNRAGLLDENTLAALRQIGAQWKNAGPVTKLPSFPAPIVARNLAKHRPAEASWSDDMWIMDFGNDDDFDTAWRSNPTVQTPWYEVDLGEDTTFNAILVAEPEPNISRYRLEVFRDGEWHPIFSGENRDRLKIHRFDPVTGRKVRIAVEASRAPAAIAEFCVYRETRPADASRRKN